MSNFTFIQNSWPQLYAEAREAEQLTFTSPKACAVICRSALEQAVHWLYANDPDLHEPYNTSLASLIHEQCFKDNLKPTMFREVNLIRMIGNNAAHGDKIRQDESLTAIKNLFRFLSWLVVYYGETEPDIKPFSESLLPTGEVQKIKLEQLKKLEDKLDAQTQKAADEHKRLITQADEIESLKEKLAQREQAVKERKEERISAVDISKAVPELISEAKTRKLYIDQLLKAAGWTNLSEGYELEYEVRGMPLSTNPSGIGYADYVLWGDNGKPLAVVEAKKTMADARKGKQQAVLYANCLEQMHGQRPVIFYTNGFETFIWDDTFYAERQIHGFYTKDELLLCIDRRSSRKDLSSFKINRDIAGRYYQEEAIKRVALNFAKRDKGNSIRAGARKALLVMATGSGKTRTSIAIVDMLTKSNWAKRVLFLADRNALVTQAKNAFAEHLPHLSSIDLTKEKEDSLTRLVFSTYPTIINKIDATRSKEERFYGVGHFDLIIIDEAHRSVYQKYGAIFEYFDSLLIGLTATPKKDIDRNTYTLFEIEDDNPTHAYELNQAVSDGYLVPPKAISVPVKFIREGITYDQLSDEEKAEYEEKFGDPSAGEADDHISSSAINKWLFNTDTVDKVINHVMTSGIKVQGGDKIGKTIFFAKNHEHAIFIEQRFNKNFPEHAGHFLRVIDNYETKAQDLLEKFVDPHKETDPQIAVSVDMMDTGIDAPRVVNLVFFKQVKSYSKFWQMIGRGTRLCEDLFAPDEDKTHFLIFDYCENLEFFKLNPEGIDGRTIRSLTERSFILKLEIITVVRENQTSNTEEEELEQYFTDQLFNQVKELDDSRFQVQMQLRLVKHFQNRSAWNNLSNSDSINLKQNIAGLILPDPEDHELARRFDIVMLNLKLAYLLSKDAGKYINKVVSTARKLAKVNVPDVKRNKELLLEIQSDQFWKQSYVKRFEEVRITVRELMKYLESEDKPKIYTNFEDDLSADSITEDSLTDYQTALKPYTERVESYLREHKHNTIIQKLRTNEPITRDELHALEDMLFKGELGSKEDFQMHYGEQPLGKFIRSIVGLDTKAANEAFAEFLNKGNLSPDQIRFVSTIISYLEKNGSIDKKMLFESPFTDQHDQGLLGVFDDADARMIVSILDRIEGMALGA